MPLRRTVSLMGGPSLVVDLRAGSGVLRMVEQERVLRAPGELDPVTGAEQPPAPGVLLEHLELLAPRHPHEVLGADADEADVADDATRDGVARRVEGLALLADQHLLRPDPNPALGALGV